MLLQGDIVNTMLALFLFS